MSQSDLPLTELNLHYTNIPDVISIKKLLRKYRELTSFNIADIITDTGFGAFVKGLEPSYTSLTSLDISGSQLSESGKYLRNYPDQNSEMIF